MKTMRFLSLVAAAAVLIVVAIGAFRFSSPIVNWLFFSEQSQTVVETTLQSVQDMNRITVFAAVLSSAATTTERGRFAPFTNRRQTLIQSGFVRYEIDLAELSGKDIAWDGITKTLSLSVPDPIPSKAEIDERQSIRYEDGQLLTDFLNKRDEITNKNRAAIYASIAKSARSQTFMEMARSAARKAVEHNFQVPLASAGVAANVIVRFHR